VEISHNETLGMIGVGSAVPILRADNAFRPAKMSQGRSFVSDCGLFQSSLFPGAKGACRRCRLYMVKAISVDCARAYWLK